jgi:hypothetical protein
MHSDGGTMYLHTSNDPSPFSHHLLVAAPSLAPLGLLDEDDEQGIILANIWHNRILEAFSAGLYPDIAHCPLFMVIEGLSQEIQTPTMQAYLADTNPLFFPAGELTCSTVTAIQPTKPFSSPRSACLPLVKPG